MKNICENDDFDEDDEIGDQSWGGSGSLSSYENIREDSWFETAHSLADAIENAFNIYTNFNAPLGNDDCWIAGMSAVPDETGVVEIVFNITFDTWMNILQTDGWEFMENAEEELDNFKITPQGATDEDDGDDVRVSFDLAFALVPRGYQYSSVGSRITPIEYYVAFGYAKGYTVTAQEVKGIVQNMIDQIVSVAIF